MRRLHTTTFRATDASDLGRAITVMERMLRRANGVSLTDPEATAKRALEDARVALKSALLRVLEALLEARS